MLSLCNSSCTRQINNTLFSVGLGFFASVPLLFFVVIQGYCLNGCKDGGRIIFLEKLKPNLSITVIISRPCWWWIQKNTNLFKNVAKYLLSFCEVRHFLQQKRLSWAHFLSCTVGSHRTFIPYMCADLFLERCISAKKNNEGNPSQHLTSCFRA